MTPTPTTGIVRVIGRTIAHYEILEKLGEGGMGAVYKARDIRLDRFVAIKVLPPDKVSDPNRVARFTQEARSASALNSPHIVTIHDISSHEEGEFIVMEFVDGRTLCESVAGGDLRVPGILKIAVQIADALGAAHSAGIIHRDLKPSNIMITDSGLVKVLDFGLAKLTAGPEPEDGRTMTLPRSDPGMIIGTVGYMSPEQVRGQPLDRRSDIFNFGLILYEMLSGRRAFQGETSVEVLSAILKEPVLDLPESVPAPLRQIVSVCLEKNPVNRFESARDVGFALSALQAGSSLSGSFPGIEAVPAKRRRLMAVVPAVILAVWALVFTVLYFSRPAAFDFSGLTYTPIATDREWESHGIWSPDGNSIAYSKAVKGISQIMVRSLTAPSASQLTSLPYSVYPVSWSNDGSKIFFLSSSRTFFSVGAAGGEPQEILPGVNSPALSPDGNTLAFWSGSEEAGKRIMTVWVSSPPGAPPRRYEPSPFEVRGNYTGNDLRFSPDGSLIGLSITLPEEAEFWLLDWPDGAKSRPRRVFAERSFSSPPEFDWMTDSRHVIMSFENELWRGDTKTGRLQKLTSSPVGEKRAPSLSPDGRRLLFSESKIEYDILEVLLDGSPPLPFLSTTRVEFSPSWSLSGDRMAYISDRSGREEVWLRSAKGEWERLIVSQDDFPDEEINGIFNAVLSPDGSRVAYNCLGKKSGAKIWISPTSGGKPMPAIPPDPKVQQFENGLSWSPDGDVIACNVFVEGVSSLAVVRVGSDKPPEFIGPRGTMSTAPAWSPDGSWIAYGCRKENTIVLISPDGKRTRSLPSPMMPYNAGFVLVWSHDGSTIYVASTRGEGRLDALDVRTGKARKVVDLDRELSFSMTNFCMFGSLSADGKSFLTTNRVNLSDLWILDGLGPSKHRRR